MAEGQLRRIVNRVKHMAATGAQPTGIYADVAALRDRAAEQARYDREATAGRYPAMEAMSSVVDRQRENLPALVDVRELVRGWRAGNISWDTDQWGPDPDDVGCLIPWDVLREAR